MNSFWLLADPRDVAAVRYRLWLLERWLLRGIMAVTMGLFGLLVWLAVYAK